MPRNIRIVFLCLLAGVLLVPTVASGAITAARPAEPSGGAPTSDDEVVAAGSRGYFASYVGERTSASDERLFQTDGTPSGTVEVPGVRGDRIDDLTPVGDTLFFRLAKGGIERWWRTDGTAAGTKLAWAQTTPTAFRVIDAGNGGAYLFSRPDGVREVVASWLALDSDAPREIGRLPGWPGKNDIAADGSLYAVAATAESRGALFHITPTTVTRLASVVESARVLAMGTGAYFAGTDPAHGNEPWVTDGTPAGSRLLVDLTPGPRPTQVVAFLNAGRTAYAALTKRVAVPANEDRPELYRLDADGVSLVAHSDGTPVRSFWEVDGSTGPLIVGRARREGDAYVTDLAALGDGATHTSLLPGPAQPIELFAVGPIMYVSDWKTETLWRTDGTIEGTWSVTELTHQPGDKGGSNPPYTGFGAVGSSLYFVRAPRGTDGLELWRTDGSRGDAHLVTRPGQIGRAPAATTLRVTRATDRTAPYTYPVRGSVTFPPDADARSLCAGTATIRVFRGRTFALPQFPLRWTDRGCAFEGTVRISTEQLRAVGRSGRSRAKGRLTFSARVESGLHIAPLRTTQAGSTWAADTSVRFGRW